jgi:hypothetical protein
VSTPDDEPGEQPAKPNFWDRLDKATKRLVMLSAFIAAAFGIPLAVKSGWSSLVSSKEGGAPKGTTPTPPTAPPQDSNRQALTDAARVAREMMSLYQAGKVGSEKWDAAVAMFKDLYDRRLRPLEKAGAKDVEAAMVAVKGMLDSIEQKEEVPASSVDENCRRLAEAADDALKNYDSLKKGGD